MYNNNHRSWFPLSHLLIWSQIWLWKKGWLISSDPDHSRAQKDTWLCETRWTNEDNMQWLFHLTWVDLIVPPLMPGYRLETFLYIVCSCLRHRVIVCVGSDRLTVWVALSAWWTTEAVNVLWRFQPAIHCDWEKKQWTARSAQVTERFVDEKLHLTDIFTFVTNAVDSFLVLLTCMEAVDKSWSIFRDTPHHPAAPGRFLISKWKQNESLSGTLFMEMSSSWFVDFIVKGRLCGGILFWKLDHIMLCFLISTCCIQLSFSKQLVSLSSLWLRDSPERQTVVGKRFRLELLSSPPC